MYSVRDRACVRRDNTLRATHREQRLGDDGDDGNYYVVVDDWCRSCCGRLMRVFPDSVLLAYVDYAVLWCVFARLLCVSCSCCALSGLLSLVVLCVLRVFLLCVFNMVCYYTLFCLYTLIGRVLRLLCCSFCCAFYYVWLL